MLLKSNLLIGHRRRGFKFGLAEAVFPEQIKLLAQDGEIHGLYEMPTDTIPLDGASEKRTAELAGILDKGGSVLVRDCYNSALRLYSNIKKHISRIEPSGSYAETRRANGRFHMVSRSIYIPSSRLRGMPQIPWWKLLSEQKSWKYIQLGSFLGLNSAWERYRKGVVYPGLNHHIHPFYNVYCPPPHSSYLKLFSSWLSHQSILPRTALEIGTGCGVLSFLLLAHGVQTVHATDINPNSVLSLKTDLWRLREVRELQGRMTVSESDMFRGLDPNKHKKDLLVFNPPWLPGPHRNLSKIEKSVFGSRDVIRQFLKDAGRFSNGSIVIVFSNQAQLKGGGNNDVQTEIERHGGYEIVRVIKGDHIPSKKRKIRDSWNQVVSKQQVIELWEIRNKRNSNQ